MSPPWTLWSATQPQIRTFLPTSFKDNSPQKFVLETHWSDSLKGKGGGDGGGGIELEVTVSEAEESGWIEAETEETVVVVEISLGIEVEITAERKKKDGFGLRIIKGIAFKNRDISFLVWCKEKTGIEKL